MMQIFLTQPGIEFKCREGSGKQNERAAAARVQRWDLALARTGARCRPSAFSCFGGMPRSVESWLETIKFGYASRYFSYFDELGIEDEEDVIVIE